MAFKIISWKWWKRQLFLWHRWMGIILSLFFAAWFISGVFMMYVEYPQLTQSERLIGKPKLDFSAANLSPSAAIARLSPDDFMCVGAPSENRCASEVVPGSTVAAASVTLGMILGRPVYFITSEKSVQPKAVFADSGEILKIESNAAREIAEDFYNRFSGGGRRFEARYLETIQTDQWTLSSSLNDHRPLFHFSINDSLGTELYVSSTTGEVVRDTNRKERFLNYFSAVTHWLYPTILRKFPDLWAWVVDILSGIGVVLTITGLWIGWLRWKKNPKPGKSAVPYRGLIRWHYFLGVAFGVMTCLWIFSGLLSMNPGKLNPSRAPSDIQKRLFSGVNESVLVDAFPMTSIAFGNNVVEAELAHFDGESFYRLLDREGKLHLLSVDGAHREGPSDERIEALASRLLPGSRTEKFTILKEYDDYYYSRHPERGGKPLPVARVQFNDDDKTWFHIDMRTGELLEKNTRVNRLYRWLYNGLHSWDILWLWERRPLWDILVIGFSFGGLFLSFTGIVAGYRRLRF